jgi:hypothetical protein
MCGYLYLFPSFISRIQVAVWMDMEKEGIFASICGDGGYCGRENE